MSNEAKSTLTVAAAFTAALLASSASQAVGTQAAPAAKANTEEIQPSPAALERLEEVAQTAWFWWPWPPRWVEVWPEVTHVESVRTA